MLKVTLSKTALLRKSFVLLALAVAKTITAQDVGPAGDTSQLHHAPADTIVQHLSDSSYYGYANNTVETIELPKVQLHPKAVSFVNNYLKSNEELLTKIKKKSAPYFKIIESLLQKHQLPVELKYLAVIESKLKATAVSKAGAVGPWQLMPKTARALGLKVTAKTDERKHYYKSTLAVCKYIKDLYRQYEDWLLVIAAYNAGPGNVDKAIKKAGSRNFWYLQYHLPAETRAHVKRFIGAHYYFEQGGGETTLTKAETVVYRRAVSAFKEKQIKALQRSEEDEVKAAQN